jgi:hypothetical protein
LLPFAGSKDLNIPVLVRGCCIVGQVFPSFGRNYVRSISKYNRPKPQEDKATDTRAMINFSEDMRLEILVSLTLVLIPETVLH